MYKDMATQLGYANPQSVEPVFDEAEVAASSGLREAVSLCLEDCNGSPRVAVYLPSTAFTGGQGFLIPGDSDSGFRWLVLTPG